MPSTYTSNNKIQKIATGEQSGTWGNTTNTNFDLFDTAIDGFVAVALTGTTHTLNIPDGTAADGRNKVISFTGTLAAANTVSITPNTVKKHYFVQNNTTGGQNVIISQGSGSTVAIKPGYSSIVYLDGAGSGASAKEVLTSLKLTALLEATGVVFVGSSSGNTTLQANATASGTLTLPAATDTLVGKATTDTFTNKTLDTAGAGNVLRINGTQVSAVTGTGSVVLATSPTLVTPLLGTPTSGTLTNCTGLPISSGVSGLGTNVATFLATPSSANLASAVTDETGSGALVFGTSPTIATPTITTSATVPLVIGGTGTTSTLTLRSTSGVGTTGADIIFQAGNNGATEVMRLQNGGNVGIGTASPSNKLTVLTTGTLNTAGDFIDVGATFTGADYAFGAGGNPAILNVHSNSTLGAGVGATIGLGGRYTGTSFGQFAIIKGAKENATDGNFATFLAFGTRANGGNITERMRIDSSGNVGIGTASPGGKLTIVSGDSATASNQVIISGGRSVSSGAGAILFTNSFWNSGFGAANIVGLDSGGSGGHLSFGTLVDGGGASGTPTEKMRILQNGNVGIGTASPVSPARLDLTKSITSNDLTTMRQLRIGVDTNSDYSGYLGYGNNSSGFYGLVLQGVHANIPSASFIALNPDGGNVGIGTASPATSAKLEIAGTTGALLVPRLTTTERNALTAVNGMIIYNTTDNQMQGRINGAWVAM